MASYVKKPGEFLIDKNTYSFAAGDYRVIKSDYHGKPLRDIIIKAEAGTEIGSNAYMPRSTYRFLKTSNVNGFFTLQTDKIEYCKRLAYNDEADKAVPEDGCIFIVKDGGTQNLGDACIYKKDPGYNDYFAAGLLSISVPEEYKYYILGILKSGHFKEYIDLYTPKGSTLRHSKKLALKYKIPLPKGGNSEKVVQFISDVVRNIIDKEEQIKHKKDLITEYINKEIDDNQAGSGFIYSYPSVLEMVEKNNRFDSGIYSKQYKQLIDKIENYRYGHYHLKKEDLHSGGTPEKRVFADNGKYLWITPTCISDEGTFITFDRISCDTNNIGKSCVLFINRTSKGKKGEYVGIAMFYDFDLLGCGQHNQGIYRLEDCSEKEKLFIACYFNSNIVRKLCGAISLGSKMKEMKMMDFEIVPIPKFGDAAKEKVIRLYYNKVDKGKGLNGKDYLAKEFGRNRELGIYQLSFEIFELKKRLKYFIDKIISGMDFEIAY